MVHRVTNFCGNTASQVDEVVPTDFTNPNSTFNISPKAACPGDSIRLTIHPATFAGNGHYFVMGNGDFVLSSKDTAWYIYPSSGDFNIELVDTNACGFSYDEDSIFISPLPATSFSFTPTNPGTGDTVWFNLDSSGSLFVYWEFDTRRNSKDLEPFFIFDEQGEYSIRLGFSGIGCEGSSEELITVGPPEGLFENQRSWAIYPNPAEGTLNILVENGQVKNFVLNDLLGRSFSVNSTSESTRTIIDLNSVPNGTYLLQFELEDVRLVEKVVVLR